MKIYKIGIIGCGGIAQKMAATLEKMKGVERYAVVSVKDKKKAERRYQEYLKKMNKKKGEQKK